MKSILVSSLLVISVTASAANKTSKTKNFSKYEEAVLKEAPYDDSWKKDFPRYSAALEEKSAKAMKQQESQRKLASDMDQEFYENKMSGPLRQFREKFLKVTSAQQLDELIVEANKNYEAYPHDLKFIAAQIIPLRSLRGIIWRLTPAADTSKAIHSFLLTQVKNIAVNLQLLLPTDQWQAGFDYVTQPFVEDGQFPFFRKGNIVGQFPKGSEKDIQTYIRTTVIPMMRTSADRLERVNLTEKLGVWDNKLLYGTGSFPSTIDRYALFGEVEKHAALSNIYAALSELNFQSAYSMSGSLEMTNEISKLYGYDSLFSKIDGVPASKRVPVIKSYSDWGVRFSDGKKWTADALFFMSKSIDHGDKMWEGMKKRPVSESFMMTNAYALPFQRPIGARFDNLKRLIGQPDEVHRVIAGEISKETFTQNPPEIHSFITDETATVNLKEFYLNPPQDLKDLYATGFEDGSEMKSTDLMNHGKKVSVEYRNFLHGRGNEWNLSVYKNYFPNVKTNKDLEKTVRVLTQGWGTLAIAVPMLNYMN